MGGLGELAAAARIGGKEVTKGAAAGVLGLTRALAAHPRRGRGEEDEQSKQLDCSTP